LRLYKPFYPREKVFRSRFTQSLRAYVKLKRALGRNYSTEEERLVRWDDYLCRQQKKHFGQKEFKLWAESFVDQSLSTRLKHLRNVRDFLRFYARDHSGVFIPELASFPKVPPPPSPRIVTAQEMTRVLALADQLPYRPCNPLRTPTIKLALILLFCCGLRMGELLRLRLRHYDPVQKILRIEMTKFYKTRLVPFTESVFGEIQHYLKIRKRNHIPMKEDSFLIWSPEGSNHAMTRMALTYPWQQLCLLSRIVDKRGRPPRMHDLRHSFAVNALYRWYIQGEDVRTKVQFLSAYLGHADIRGTHRYLHLTPELREEASDRFHHHFAPLFEKGATA